MAFTDLSSLAQPAAGAMPTPGIPAPPPEAMAAPDITDTSINPRVAPAPPAGGTPVGTPTPTPAGPHSRLMAMVQGLAIGASSFGTAAATGGREGGAPEVQKFYAAQQEQKIQAQQAQAALKNAGLQQQLMNGQIVEQNAHNYQLLSGMPDIVKESHFKAIAAEQGAQTGAIALQNARKESMATWGTDPLAPSTPSGAAQNMEGAIRVTQQLIKFASDPRVLGSGNPDVKVATDALAAAQKTGNVDAVTEAMGGLRRALSYHQQAVEAGIKQQTQAEAAPFGDRASALNTAMTERYQVLNPGKPLPDAYKLTPDSTPKDFDRVDKIMQQTEGAQATKANRDIVNGMREQMLNLAKGAEIPGDETKTGAEYMATLPAGLQGTVKSIGEGRAAPPPAGSRSPAAQSILGALNRAYPDYDVTKYPSYLEARKKFTAGPEGKGINAINTVETHLARMYDHATAPGTSGGITGKVTGFFGDKDVRALDIDRTAVSTELSKAYAAGQISEGEVRDWEEKLDFTKPGMTTGKLITNLKEIDSLLEGKQKAYEQQWSTASPSANIVSPVPIISPDAAAARAKIRGEQESAAAATAPKAADFARPATVSAGAKLMQVPGGQPHWIEPANQSAAQSAGAVEVQ